MLKHVFVYRVHDYQELMEVLHLLPQLVENSNRIKLIVVDSIAFHFRHAFSDMYLRSYKLNNIASQLHTLSNEFNLAILLVNQVTTRKNANSMSIVPALGDSWAHNATNRIELSNVGEYRKATLTKCPYLKMQSCRYTINHNGFRNE